jgi:hypothetical protein
MVIVGSLSLSMVLGTWAQLPRVVPPIFGTAGGIAVISLSLIAVIAAAFSRRLTKRWRRTVGVANLLLGVAAELLAVGHITSGRGAPDTHLGLILSAGAVAMVVLAYLAFQGGPK